MNYGDWQNLVYAQALAGESPAYPVEWAELEEAAAAKLDEGPRGYVWGGGGSGDTMRANLEAFRRWRLVPRHLRDTAERDLSVELLGAHLPAPVMLAPIGVQEIVHPDGELASARGAAAAGLPVVASSAASRSMEEVAEAHGELPRWYQLYWPKDPELMRSWVGRAEAAGYGAIVVTLDNVHLGYRPTDLTTGFFPFMRGVGIAQYTSDPVFRARLEKPIEEDEGAAIGEFLAVVNEVITWDDLPELRSATHLPIVLKGMLDPDDAKRAREAGVDGVIVSNHGGRQVDGAIAALDALPDVAAEVGGDLAVLFDSGIRGGADAAKALALGAEAVLLGRPYLWGLALGGAEGVEHVLRMLLAELDLTMALCGARTPADLTPDLLTHAPR